MNGKLDLTLFGAPRIAHAGVPINGFISRKVQALLIYLALSGRPHSRINLATLLWGDRKESAARGNLRKALSNLRHLAGDYFIIDRQQVAFRREIEHRIDVVEFERQVQWVAGQDITAAHVEHLSAAVALYRGDFLEGFFVNDAPDFENWMLAERARLRTLALNGLDKLAQSLARQGDLEQAIAQARHLLHWEPWREETHRQLMEWLAQTGQRSAALAQYEICRTVLQGELGAEPDADTRALYERLLRAEPSVAAARSSHSASDENKQAGSRAATDRLHSVSRALRHNLPAQPTPFVGREQELADIVAHLQEPACRLLSLVGPGGIGKSRLALQTAQILTSVPPAQTLFDHGIWFVQLGAATSPAEVVAAIGEAFALVSYSNVSPRQQLLDHLREKALLLVLDNFEHLLSAANLLVEILANAPAVKLLVTSREALNLREEWFHAVEGLAIPPADTSGEALTSYDAVRLFVQNAQRARASFALTEESQAVVRICRLVQGMPLGIELAAAWLRALPCATIAREIAQNLDFLTSRLQNVPARHRSMPRRL